MVFAFVGGAVVGSRRSVGFAVCRDRGVERRGNIRMMDGGERSSAEKMVQRMREMARKDIELENARGLIPSHRTVRRDENGEPLMERFVYVDEIDCIGCSHCAMTARNTFFLEEEFGRARAFRQDADPVGLIEEAIDTYVKNLTIMRRKHFSQMLNGCVCSCVDTDARSIASTTFRTKSFRFSS